jgi:hypothetical protein
MYRFHHRLNHGFGASFESWSLRLRGDLGEKTFDLAKAFSNFGSIVGRKVVEGKR